MDSPPPSPPQFLRTLLAGVLAALGLAVIVLWNWHVLEQRQQVENHKRFDLNMQALGEVLTARMRSYEMVLRGVSSAFVGDVPTYTHWNRIMDQLRLQEVYPGISSIAWSRALRGEQLDAFETRIRADGRPDFWVFPQNAQAHYLPIEYIGPITAHTSAAEGLDLFTQDAQRPVIEQAIDNGQTFLSPPLSDLYEVSHDVPQQSVGALMYFPVYTSGAPPTTVDARRASFAGVTSVAFRGDELVEGVFGSRLQLFYISAYDGDTNQLLFDSRQVQSTAPPAGWKPQLSGQMDIPLYGRTWRLHVQGTPEYEISLIARSHDLVLVMGLSTAVLLGFLAGGFVWQRDCQMYAREKVTLKLREQTEQLMVASRYKSEFLANMSHELRTPLNSILILSDQLRQNAGGNLTEKQTRHADIVYRAGSDLLQLINDVLDLSKIEAGRMQISMEPLSLQDLLVDLDASMRPLAEAKGLQLHITPAENIPQRVYTDRVRLHQILRNLLSNAIKFTDSGQVDVEVSAHPAHKDGSVPMHFSVRDTGIGIDPKHHKQVFEAFQQLDGSTRRRFGGTGLGLVITRQLAQAMGGEITLQSTPGQGSTFTASIPMQPIAVQPRESVPSQRSGSGPAVLVVEDDTEFATVITEQAHTHGFSTVHCTTGSQALELLQAEAFVAVILDILLPDVSGWQLFRRLRALPAHQRTPVHIISCLPQPSGMDTGQGSTHYLTKPIGQTALEQVFAHLQQGPADGPSLLLVEDTAHEREHYGQQLQSLGFHVTTCETAAQAHALWKDKPFEVLVIDLNLPDQDGFALLDSLEAVRTLQGVRVVVNTGLDVDCQGLQHLHNYSAVVVRKQGSDTTMLGQAVQGFLGLLAPAPATASPPPAADGTVQPHPGLQGKRLLLVDDDIRNVYAMSALLDGFGLYVNTAINGQDAIDCWKSEPLDLILMDMSMPVMDGYTATGILKTELGCTIPVVALTAHAMTGDREKCIAAGCDDYMAKPVQRQALHDLLVRWLLKEA